MNILKQAGSSAKDAAKKIAQQIKQEPGEFLQNAKDQVVRPESRPAQNGPSMMQEVMSQGGGEVTASEEQSIHAQAKSRLQKIEAELRQLRMQREKRSEEWVREQEQMMSPRPEDQQKAETPIPQGIKRGAPRPGKKKSGNTDTMENSKQKKG